MVIKKMSKAVCNSWEGRMNVSIVPLIQERDKEFLSTGVDYDRAIEMCSGMFSSSYYRIVIEGCEKGDPTFVAYDRAVRRKVRDEFERVEITYENVGYLSVNDKVPKGWVEVRRLPDMLYFPKKPIIYPIRLEVFTQ